MAGEWWSGGHGSLVAVDDGGLSLTLGDGEFQASALAAAPGLHHGWEGAGPAPEPGAGVLFSWQPRSAALGMRFGALREFESALGTSASGAFGKLASGVVFAGTGFGAEAGGWGIEAGAELGVAGSEASGGIVREVSTLATSAFSLSAERGFEDGGRLRFSLSQPLRVESGRMRLAVPTGRTKRGEVVRGIVDAPLIPTGRQIDLGADWRRPVGAADGELRLGATVSFQPGHATGRAPDLTLLAGYRLAFRAGARRAVPPATPGPPSCRGKAGARPPPGAPAFVRPWDAETAFGAPARPRDRRSHSGLHHDHRAPRTRTPRRASIHAPEAFDGMILSVQPRSGIRRS